ncbi:MAG: HutD family protein [Pseudomonadota bacterium]|nr:HutD family protein [Pseudomonadota bacterium]
MSPVVIRTDDTAPQPWRNGGGRTREMMAWPDAANWQIRISVAEVEANGPFSVFRDVQRWFAVLQGAGIELTIDGLPQRMIGSDGPLRFDGAASTTCRLLDGPIRDLNLMLRDVPGRMVAAADGVEWRPLLAQCGLYSMVAGQCRADDQVTALPVDSLLWFERAPASLRFDATQPPGPAWWFEAGTVGKTA